jgi:hypothetical protein
VTAGEFRSFVERYSTQPTALSRIRDVADTFGWGFRRVHAYYYGERRVPDHIAQVVKPSLKSKRAAVATQANATLLMVRAEFDRLEGYVSAVENMCRECEPSGECQVPTCPLRSVSPLPLARSAG